MPTELTCPACHKPLRVSDRVGQRWVTCPYCLARMANPNPATHADDDTDHEVERAVQSDTRKTSWLIVVLAVIGGLNVLTVIPAAIGGIGKGDWEGVLGVGVVLALVVGLTTLFVVWRRPGRTAMETVGAVAVRSLAVIGSLVAGMFVLGIALAVFIFAVCLAGSRGWH